MEWFVLIALIVFTMGAWVAVARSRRNGNQIHSLMEQNEFYQKYLMFFLEHYQLLSNPFVSMPTYDEPRCWHCHVPRTEQHKLGCPWQQSRILVEYFSKLPNSPLPEHTRPFRKPENVFDMSL